MKKLTKYIAIFIAAISLSSCGYNSMVTSQEAATGQWANVESSYQRRADLIPNLVATVKGYAGHEKETLTEVINARAKATSVTIDASKLDANSIAKFQEAQQGLTGALNKLMVVAERYPDLKASQQFIGLQSQLEGTENRINVERNRFNNMVIEYNTMIRKFPKNITANIFSFEKMEYFKADPSASKAPEVKF
ncbi:LemA family protein [Wenyingzhuangia sp. 2_MG-2023]|uniref:LemA family protein n=1 Tax=Wenyingzhuangia sp. 2_MG-2023 TaxID=3062639 RepID=UPI0026E253F2|nr:LemA family protein [Wenyingzhuangia sp. 2_MG-2023]MDO6738035.1 LemA family protein [Wenyingzhuangia sp. 2_MG-2023]